MIFFTLKQSRKLLLATLLTLLGMGTTAADELTIYDGAGTSCYIPIQWNYGDAQGSLSEFIIPASQLTSIEGSNISKMTFYMENKASKAMTAIVKVYLKEISQTTFESNASFGSEGATEVYSGTLDASTENTMDVNFTTPYNYEGGNLLVGFEITTAGNYVNVYFLGVTQSENTGFYNKSYKNRVRFLPKTTLTYSSASVSGPALSIKDYKNGGTVAFGMVNAGATKTITVKNPGTETLTANVTTTGGYTASPTSLSIDAKGEQTLTITVPDATANGTVTITPTAQGVDAITLNLTCTVKDPNKMFVDFNDNQLPDGWEAVAIGSYAINYSYGWSFDEGFATYKKSSSSEQYATNYYHSLVSPMLTFADNEKVIFKLKKNTEYTSYVGSLYVEYSADKTTWTTATDGHFTPDIITDDWKECEATIPSTAKYIRFRACGVSIDDIYGGEESNEPMLNFTATDYAFGMIVTATTSTDFTIKNTGKGELTGLSVTCDNSNFTVAVANNATTIDGKSQATFTVTLNTTAKGLQNGKVTIKTTGFEDVTFNVTGYVADDSKIFVNFNGNTVPDGWENKGWKLNNNEATGGYVSGNKDSDANLISPNLTVTEGETMAIEAMGTGSSAELRIYKSTDDGANWELLKNLDSEAKANTTSYTVFVIDDLAAGNYKLMFVGYQVKINAINGYSLNASAPIMGMFSDADCTAAAAATETKDFGFNAEKQAATYYIKNTGTGTLNLTKGEVTAGFSAELEKTALEANESTKLTISQTLAGYQQGSITVNDENNNTFTVNVSGVVLEDGKNYVNMAGQDSDVPASWTKNSWTTSAGENGYIASGSTSNDLITAKMEVAEGEQLIISASGDSKSYYNAAALTVSYSADGETWTEAKDVSSQLLSTSTWYTIAIDGIPAGTQMVKFTGKNAYLQRIYGFEAVKEPVMITDAADYDFGMQTAEGQKQFNVKNEGTATLKNITAVLTAGDESDFTVSIAKNELAPTEETTITVTQKFDLDDLGQHSDVLTIKADGQADVVVNLTGQTRDPEKLYVDFEDNQLPADWTGWSIATTNGNHYAKAPVAADATLTTSPLTVAEGEVLTFQAARAYASDAPTLKVRWSTDGTMTWSEYKDLADQVADNSFATIALNDVPKGNVVVLEFLGQKVNIDNIYGFKRNDSAPLISLTLNDEPVDLTATYDFGNLTADKDVTYVLKNTGKGTLEMLVDDAFDVLMECDKIQQGSITLEPGESADIKVYMIYTSPYGEKKGSVEFVSDLGDFTLNFKGFAVDQTGVNIDFTDTEKLDGWYNGGWTIGDDEVAATTGDETILITYKMKVEGLDDVLKFDAKFKSQFNNEFIVSYSTDRQNWTDQNLTEELNTQEWKTMELKGLEAGEYYVKFTGKWAQLDNITGWHFVEGIEHDLYLVSAELPTEDVIPMSTYTAKLTVVSLRADETMTGDLDFGQANAQTQNIALTKGQEKEVTLTIQAPEEEGTYQVCAKLTNTDTDVVTEPVSVKVAHQRTVEIEEFALTSDAAVTADADNNFEATFSVKLKNTGSVKLQPNEVSVSITDANGKVYQTAQPESVLSKDGEQTLTITVKTSALEGGDFTFTAKAQVGEQQFSTETTATVSVTASAPKFELAEGNDALTDGQTVTFGVTKENVSKTFTVKNTGTGNLLLKSVTAPEGFTITELTDENKTIAPEGEQQFVLTLVPEEGKYGKKQGDVAFTYAVDAENDNTFSLAVSGRTISADTWAEDFEEGEIPADWNNENNWVVSETDGNHYIRLSGWDAKAITTPRLAAAKDEILTFDVLKAGNSLTIEYSTDDRQSWSEPVSISETGEQTFTAPADGNYYLRLTGRNAYLDNFVGFKLSPLEHDAQIVAQSIPAEATQYTDYTATVTVKENVGKDEAVTAKLFVNGEAVKEVQETALKSTTTVITLTYQPQEATTAPVKAYVEVTYAGGTLKTEEVDLTINAPLTLDATATTAPELSTGNQPVMVLKRQFTEGYNVIALPFNCDVTAFGEGFKAYKFNGYEDFQTGEGKYLDFVETTTIGRGDPHILFVPAEAPAEYLFRDVTIDFYGTEAGFEEKGGVRFKATYAAIGEGLKDNYLVDADGAAIKAGDDASVPGYSGYLVPPTNFEGDLIIRIDGTATAISTARLFKQAEGRAYNFNGQRVENLKKGQLYIIDGKKVIVK